MKVMSEACLASIRKCLQGLDYYVAEREEEREGGKVFDDLETVVDRLLAVSAVSVAEAESLKKSLKDEKQYVKSEFKVSSVPCKDTLICQATPFSLLTRTPHDQVPPAR